MCLQKSLGGANALVNPLGELELDHGTLIGILLPHVLAFNAEHAELAFADLKAPIKIQENIQLHAWMSDFVRNLGLPTTLSSLGVGRDALDGIAQKASIDHLSATNPKPATTQDYLGILLEAL